MVIELLIGIRLGVVQIEFVSRFTPFFDGGSIKCLRNQGCYLTLRFLPDNGLSEVLTQKLAETKQVKVSRYRKVLVTYRGPKFSANWLHSSGRQGCCGEHSGHSPGSRLPCPWIEPNWPQSAHHLSDQPTLYIRGYTQPDTLLHVQRDGTWEQRSSSTQVRRV
jgi:hypothetical protein